MADDRYAEARREGYTDAEIIDFRVKQDPSFGAKLKSARDEGYSDSEIAQHLSNAGASAAKPEKSFSGFLSNLLSSGKKQVAAVGELAYKANPVTGFSPVTLEGKPQTPPFVKLMQEIGVFPVGAAQKLMGMEGESSKALDAIGADYKAAYGSKEQFLETLYSDPMRAISDLSMLAGGSTAGLKAAGAAAKAGGATRTASAVAKAAKTTQKVDDILNLPARAAGGVVKGVGKLSEPGPMREDLARSIYASAIKPREFEKLEDRNRMLDFGLDHEVHPGDYKKSEQVLSEATQAVNDKVAQIVGTISPRKVAARVDELKQGSYGKQTDNKAAVRDINDSVDRILERYSVQVPGMGRTTRRVSPTEAMEAKRADYAVVGDDAYNGMKGLPVETKKASARGWKEELEFLAPEISDLNQYDAAAIDLNQAIQHRFQISDRSSPFSLSTALVTAGGLAAGGAEGAMAAAALKYALMDPRVQSRLAVVIRKGQIKTATAEQLIRGAQTGVGPGSKAAVAARIEEIMRQLEAGQAQAVPAH